MELRDLRAFATTVEVGAITRAAERLHLGIFFLPVDEQGLEIPPLSSIDLVLVVPADHPIARRRRVVVSDLRGEAWVTFPAANPGRAWLESALREAGDVPDTLVEVET